MGDLGPWSERIYLAGGLAPRYLVGALPEGARPHVGTTDVDMVIGVALSDDTPETYRTLQTNLRESNFEQRTPSFQWARAVDGSIVLLEFLCETDTVPDGNIFSPKDGTGSKMAAFNVRGAMLAREDFVEIELEGERLDDGGQSRVQLRVVNLLPYAVLKIFAFQERHENKDAYDLVFTLLNANGGPLAAGRLATASPVAAHPRSARRSSCSPHGSPMRIRTGLTPTRTSWPATIRTRSHDFAGKPLRRSVPSSTASMGIARDTLGQQGWSRRRPRSAGHVRRRHHVL